MTWVRRLAQASLHLSDLESFDLLQKRRQIFLRLQIPYAANFSPGFDRARLESCESTQRFVRKNYVSWKISVFARECESHFFQLLEERSVRWRQILGHSRFWFSFARPNRLRNCSALWPAQP